MFWTLVAATSQYWKSSPAFFSCTGCFRHDQRATGSSKKSPGCSSAPSSFRGFVAFLDHQLYLVDSRQVESTTTLAPVAFVYRLFGFWPAAGLLTAIGVGIAAATVWRMATFRG